MKKALGTFTWTLLTLLAAATGPLAQEGKEARPAAEEAAGPRLRVRFVETRQQGAKATTVPLLLRPSAHRRRGRIRLRRHAGRPAVPSRPGGARGDVQERRCPGAGGRDGLARRSLSPGRDLRGGLRPRRGRAAAAQRQEPRAAGGQGEPVSSWAWAKRAIRERRGSRDGRRRAGRPCRRGRAGSEGLVLHRGPGREAPRAPRPPPSAGREDDRQPALLRRPAGGRTRSPTSSGAPCCRWR